MASSSPGTSGARYVLPWPPAQRPLMLAPMQGLTNRAMRSIQAELGRPDVLFTEFLRVRQQQAHRITRSDRRESVAHVFDIPLVAQLMGHSVEALTEAAQQLQSLGAKHINLNMGCPFGRMNSGRAGGAMLQEPQRLPECLAALRQVISGSFSVKVRAGYQDPEQIFTLLPLFEQAGVDFLILHPRTVVQKYSGLADHRITAEVVAATALPVIANGDVVSAGQGLQVLENSGATGLMLGRGAIADPWLFQRLRGVLAEKVTQQQRYMDACHYLQRLLVAYAELFCGDQQVLGKMKEVANCMTHPQLKPVVKQLMRCRTLNAFKQEITMLAGER